MLTREEYKKFYDSFQCLKMKCDLMDAELACAKDRINRLWDELNRPAIEESVKKADEEYYKWCDEVAKKYEKLDEEEWITSRAKFYNNGVYDFCQENGIPEEEAYAHRQYYDGIKFWSTSSVNSGLMDECDDMEFDVAKTEGWSDLPYFKCGESWIMNYAMDDILERYDKNKNITGCCEGPYWHLWMTFDHMLQESNEFFR